MLEAANAHPSEDLIITLPNEVGKGLSPISCSGREAGSRVYLKVGDQVVANAKDIAEDELQRAVAGLASDPDHLWWLCTNSAGSGNALSLGDAFAIRSSADAGQRQHNQNRL